MTDPALYRLAEDVGEALKRRGLMLATAESCTGGWVSQAVTMVPGSSDWFERGFVTYTYISKREMLGVEGVVLERYGAVSEQVVRQMVNGALEHSHAQVAVGVSGVAGPSGGSAEKPVGTVCFGWGMKGSVCRLETVHFPGDREAVRRLAVERALRGTLELLASQGP